MIFKAYHLLRQQSISKTIALWYSIATSLVLLLACLLLYFALVQSLEKQNSQFLVGEIGAIREVINHSSSNIQTIQFEIGQQIPVEFGNAAFTKHHYFYRVLNQQGQILFETPGMSELLPSGLFPKPLSGLKEADKNIHSEEDKPYFLMSAWADTSQQRLIQVAVETHSEREIVEDYQDNLCIVLLFGILLSVVIGLVGARRSIRPLQSIVEKVSGITTTQLHQRLDETSLPLELRRLAETLNGFLSRIEEGFQRLSQFSVDLAHELRTPINNLMGETELALTRQRSALEYRQVLESSLEEYARLSTLIDSLLFLARTENPRNQIKYEWIPLPQILNKLCEFYGIAAEEKQVKLICEASGELYADLILFRQAVSNLLSNALQHTDSGGTITLSSRHTDHCVEIIVEDTGVGIAPEHLPHILNRFYRVDSARSKKSGGTGLGLAIVKSIMALHNGSVRISSTVNQGTKIILTFRHAVTL